MSPREVGKVEYKPIGMIHTPNEEADGTPIQPKGAEGVRGEVEIYPEYVEGLKDLEGFSQVILIYHFHKSEKGPLQVKPYMDDKRHGVFSMRGPSRPNPIGLSVVKLEKIEENRLIVKNVDILDGTPLLDIKPYVPDFDRYSVESYGWLEKNVHKLSKTTDDGRFFEE
ncbi:MAG: tRNA (N6-threonylcarbamoyladenosine(37)-N6)-methyltransferase TrmO [Candidatus Thermoplasmatota archaeon]|nr:tRNA (N6-threonylcarbamoyladenosine(37)-N6)-methyltransferase TrmO [Candidatus Thermoplasmatota archaeon]MBS3789417.1 tRNA (N6-threonylcarbamoyladenosine(37)-N6)-methyltransferase TrmO [Candidatus Thermoplasmatota archaeon]